MLVLDLFFRFRLVCSTLLLLLLCYIPVGYRCFGILRPLRVICIANARTHIYTQTHIHIHTKVHTYIHTYIHTYMRSIRRVMVITVGNGHGDTSSNPGRDRLHFTLY